MTMTIRTTALSAILLAASGCNVDKTGESTGGVEFDGTKPVCERGLTVVMGDYSSTNIGIAKLDGTMLSESFISSSAATPGLSLALSGDVDVPRVAPASGKVVLLDRFGKNVVTWLDLDSAEVLGQLAVGTGFESNPQDYLEYDTDRAVVSRFGTNTNPGQEDYDEGGDLLLLDTKARKILGRIAMPEEDAALLPRPTGMTMLGETVVVTLGRLSADFSQTGAGRFVGVQPSTKKILWTVDIKGVKNCGRLAKSPSGLIGAIACSSQTDSVTYQYNPKESDVVIYNLTVTPPKELRRLGLGQAIDSGLQTPLEFASESKLVALAYGGNSVVGDRAFVVDVETGDYEELLKANTAYSLPGVHCAPGCGDVCVISDKEAGVLRRFEVNSKGKFTRLDDVTPDSTIGLPPRSMGAL